MGARARRVGRTARRWRWSAPAVLAVVLLACGASGPTAVSLAELVADQERLDGQLVVSEGTVHTYDDPRHYWIEDDEVNRVELVPHEVVGELVGARVRVTGRYHYRDDRGRLIEVDDLQVLEPAGRA